MIRLGVNVDHVATLREARKGTEPDPVAAALAAEAAGADQITVHLREDRRHIQNRDVRILSEVVQTRLNLEMAATDEITEIALALRPDSACLVPEKREEVTTEGGLDVVSGGDALRATATKLREGGILISLFIDPEADQVRAAARTGAHAVELHTGEYSLARTQPALEKEFARLSAAAEEASRLGLRVHAGHGLNYHNTPRIIRLPHLEEVNIGHAIISRAVFTGLDQAVREMLRLLGR
jgi:pyridoxine 5-phosphate synthase